MSKVQYAHFSEEDTEGQGGEVACLRDTASNSNSWDLIYIQKFPESKSSPKPLCF